MVCGLLPPITTAVLSKPTFITLPTPSTAGIHWLTPHISTPSHRSKVMAPRGECECGWKPKGDSNSTRAWTIHSRACPRRAEKTANSRTKRQAADTDMDGVGGFPTVVPPQKTPRLSVRWIPLHIHVQWLLSYYGARHHIPSRRLDAASGETYRNYGTRHHGHFTLENAFLACTGNHKSVL